MIENNVLYIRTKSVFINPDKESNPAAARESKKAFVMGLNLIDLHTDKFWTKDHLRALATGLIQTQDGKKYASKALLIERLEAYVKEERRAILVRGDHLKEGIRDLLVEGRSLLQSIPTLIDKYTGDKLAESICALLDSSGHSDSTLIKTHKPDILKLLRETYDRPDLNYVIKKINDYFHLRSRNVDNETKAKVAEYCADRVGTKWNILYPRVLEFLENPNATWKELSFALALVTGRRCAEIHGIDCKITQLSPTSVLFEGQLKTKGQRDVRPYEIPVIAPADLVVAAWDKLRVLGKVGTPEKVNSTISKALASELPANLRQLKEDSNIKIYKDFRDSYAAKLSEDTPQTMSRNKFLASIMGHGEHDLTTAGTYDKRFIDYSL